MIAVSVYHPCLTPLCDLLEHLQHLQRLTDVCTDANAFDRTWKPPAKLTHWQRIRGEANAKHSSSVVVAAVLPD